MSKRLAIVTGATRGIGAEIAAQLLSYSCHVIATGTKPKGQAPKGCEYYSVDFSQHEEVSEFSQWLTAKQPDILINNAGINKVLPFAEVSLEVWNELLQVNVTAPFQLMQAVLIGMRKKQWGRIVNISSVFGKISKAHRAPYSATKFALDGMSAALAAEVAEEGILVNCVAPGFIETDLTRGVLGEQGMQAIAQTVPIKRLGTTKEVAKFVAWLASEENTFISGQNLAIDGGFTRV